MGQLRVVSRVMDNIWITMTLMNENLHGRVFIKLKFAQ